MHLRAQPIRLLNGLLGDVCCLLLRDVEELLHPPSESGEVGMSCSSICLLERLTKLTVVRHECVVLLQQPSDLSMGRLHKMINGLALISFARHGKAAVIAMLVNSWGHIHAGSLHAKVPLLPESSQGNGT